MTEFKRVRLRSGFLQVNGDFNIMRLDECERRLLSNVSDAIAAYQRERQFLLLPAGTIVHVGGIPVELVKDVEIATRPENYKLIELALADQRHVVPGSSGEAQSGEQPEAVEPSKPA